MVGFVVLEWVDAGSYHEDVGALGEGVDTFERDYAFAEFAHCHEEGGEFVWGGP